MMVITHNPDPRILNASTNLVCLVSGLLSISSIKPTKMLAIKWIQILARLILYILLFAFFCLFYMIDQMSDYIKGRTTVSSRFEEVDSFEPPTVTVCMFPPYQPTKMSLYGLEDEANVIFQDFVNQTLENRMNFLGYLLERDFTIEMSLYLGDEGMENLSKNVEVGVMQFDNMPIRVQAIYSQVYGVCYKIQPSFAVSSHFWQNLQISVNSSLKTEDRPLKAIMYLTSNNTWQGITTSDWPQFTPSKIELDIGNGYFMQLKPTEYLFSHGVENSEECWKKHILKSKCAIKCKYASFTDLPMCKSSQEAICIAFNGEMGDPWNDCNSRKKAFTYPGELTKRPKFTSNNDTSISIGMLYLRKEVKEEIEVISLSNLIGSLGGSLGMFFGFSISAYALYLMDKFIVNILTSQRLLSSN